MPGRSQLGQKGTPIECRPCLHLVYALCMHNTGLRVAAWCCDVSRLARCPTETSQAASSNRERARLMIAVPSPCGVGTSPHSENEHDKPSASWAPGATAFASCNEVGGSSAAGGYRTGRRTHTSCSSRNRR